MALAMRLSRGGRKSRPFYRIVVTDKRMPRDGRYIEKLGTYNPLLANDDEKRVVINDERIQYWLEKGAQPSTRVQKLLSAKGLTEAPEIRETPKKSAQSEKTKMRIADKEEKKKAAEEAAKAVAEEEKAEQETTAAAETEAKEEAPAEEVKAEEKPAEDVKAEEKPADDVKEEEKSAEETKAEEKPAEDVKEEEKKED